MQTPGPIGVFDSGYGGLTVLKEMVRQLPQYDYLYLGDNARSPYGSRSFHTVYQYTRQCVTWLFNQGCHLVILACNTASAKALRTIQQNDLPNIAPAKRVLGVIRPTAEIIGRFSNTKNIGIVATSGTVASGSYALEIKKFFPNVKVVQQACPMWVSLVENEEYKNAGADYFVKKNLEALLKKENDIDVLLLGCTHYPLLKKKIQEYLPSNIKIISQGHIIAESLADYLRRHLEIERNCSKTETRIFYTTDSNTDFDKQATKFYDHPVSSKSIDIEGVKS